ncbi:flagellar motor switch protein FliN [Thermovibrio sp.]
MEEEVLKAQQETKEAEGGAREQEGKSSEDIMAARQEGSASSSPELNSESEVKEGEERCDGKMELLKDIPLEITVEVGSTRLPLEEILNLHTNSVVELDRFVDEPVDIKINGKLVAKGKLYVVKDSYGVEIVQIITPEERLKLIEE